MSTCYHCCGQFTEAYLQNLDEDDFIDYENLITDEELLETRPNLMEDGL